MLELRYPNGRHTDAHMWSSRHQWLEPTLFREISGLRLRTPRLRYTKTAGIRGGLRTRTRRSGQEDAESAAKLNGESGYVRDENWGRRSSFGQHIGRVADAQISNRQRFRPSLSTSRHDRYEPGLGYCCTNSSRHLFKGHKSTTLNLFPAYRSSSAPQYVVSSCLRAWAFA
ncbi:hypothetical protein BDW68DRAFT_168842 [Aspergillus falconensis]